MFNKVICSGKSTFCIINPDVVHLDNVIRHFEMGVRCICVPQRVKPNNVPSVHIKNAILLVYYLCVMKQQSVYKRLICALSIHILGVSFFIIPM